MDKKNWSLPSWDLNCNSVSPDKVKSNKLRGATWSPHRMAEETKGERKQLLFSQINVNPQFVDFNYVPRNTEV